MKKKLLVTAILAAIGSMAGCASTERMLQGVDYGCLDIEVDGYFTDSGATGRAIKVPAGVVPDNALIALLCP